MKALLSLACAAVLISSMSTQCCAADHPQQLPDLQQLTQMGLDDLSIVSDEEGQLIRGQGFGRRGGRGLKNLFSRLLGPVNTIFGYLYIFGNNPTYPTKPPVPAVP